MRHVRSVISYCAMFRLCHSPCGRDTAKRQHVSRPQCDLCAPGSANDYATCALRALHTATVCKRCGSVGHGVGAVSETDRSKFPFLANCLRACSPPARSSTIFASNLCKYATDKVFIAKSHWATGERGMPHRRVTRKRHAACFMLAKYHQQMASNRNSSMVSSD